MGHPLRSAGQGERRQFVATAEGRIDAALAAADSSLTRARVQRLIDEGLVALNGEPVRKSARLVPGDTVDYELPLVEHAPAATGIDIPVLYEDDLLLAIDKPAALNTHGAPGDNGPSVAAWFVEHHLSDSALFEADRPGIVHRLDRDTTGVLLLAKTPEAQATLSHAFEDRSVAKTYVALTAAVPARERALIDAPIGRHPADRTRMAVVSRGRPARTSYEVKAASGDIALVELRLETGRTHQARVHLAAINAPVLGDTTYGRPASHRQALHAWRIEIPHPRGGRLTVTAPLAHDMREAARAAGLLDQAMPYFEAHPPACGPDDHAAGRPSGNES